MMHYGKKAGQRRQSDALGNVLLGNLGSCPSCACFFEMYHLPRDCCRLCTTLHGNGDGSGLFQPHNIPCHTATNCTQMVLRNTTKSSRCFLGPQIPCGVRSSITSNPSRPISQLAGIKGFAANVLLPDTPGHIQISCGVQSMSRRIRIVLATRANP